LQQHPSANLFLPSPSEEERALLKEFTRGALCVDGVQLLRFLSTHAGAMTARDIAMKLFDDFIVAKTSKSKVMNNPNLNRQPINAFSSTPKRVHSSRDLEPLLNGHNDPITMTDLPRVLPANAPINSVYSGFPRTDMKRQADALPMKEFPREE
uniref:SEC7 domain-containing protein n=1 Tax=Anisakis simplex TaxID=6269 RepID=A0A0M3KDH1_ANISI